MSKQSSRPEEIKKQTLEQAGQNLSSFCSLVKKVEFRSLFCSRKNTFMDNNTSHSLSPPFVNFKSISHMSIAVAVSILSPLAVVANGLVLAAIWRNPSLRTPSYVLLAGLALTDFGTGLISQPLYTIELMYFLDTRGSTVVTYAIVDGSVTFFSHSTIFIMTIMSVERWLHMARRSLISVRRACFIVVFLFLLPIPITVYRVFQRLRRAPTTVTDVISCSLVPILLTLTSVAYLQVFRIIRRHQHQIQANEMSQNFPQPAINLTKYKKSVFSILYILVVFSIGYVPVAICMGMSTVWMNELVALWVNISFVLMFLSSSLNPLLYLWRMKDIRNEVKLLVKRILHC